ncbi:MAG: hypothetical protein AAF633_26790, partial [Chloroflexota bacterium]
PNSKDDWNIYIVGFSKMGWEEEAVQYIERLANGDQSSSWKAKWYLLKTFEEMDNDLYQWLKDA